METENLLAALGTPMRYRIFSALLERKHCVRSLSKEFSISESAISQHLKIMREAGLVYGEKFGYHTHYFPQQEAIDYLAQAFQHMSEQSSSLNRDTTACQCLYRKEEAR